ncbi:MAG: hypothetical protein JXP34_21875 [Planctomycetes bacterium]|nr:hypothetical protein [Planctomycetota bacterium]
MDDETARLVSAFLEGDLSHPDAAHLAEILASHPEDRREFLALAEQARVLDVLFGPSPPLPDLVMEEIRAERNGARFTHAVMTRLVRRRRRRWAWVAAAAVLLAAGASLWLRGYLRRAAPSPEEPPVTKVDPAPERKDRPTPDEVVPERKRDEEPEPVRKGPPDSEEIEPVRDEDAVREGLAELKRLEPRVFTFLSQLDFSAPPALIDDFEARRPGCADEAAALRDDLDAARAAWDSLVEAFRSAAASGEPLSLRFDADPLQAGERPSGRYLVLGISPPRITLQGQTEGVKREIRSFFSISPEDLLSLIGRRRDTEPVRARMGLAWLLLVRRGPDRARTLLAAQEIPPEVREAGEARIGRLEEIWLPERLREAEQDLARLREKEAPEEECDYVARQAASILADAAGDTVVPAVEKIYVAARAEALQRRSLERFVHAKGIERSAEGLVALAYDFSSAEQVEDFIPVDRTDSRFRWMDAANAFELTGECRFLRGNPFEGELRIRGRVGACDAKAPNVNAALWTRPGDRVTPRAEGIGRRVSMGDGLTGYLVCGMGYRSPPRAEAPSAGVGGEPGKEGPAETPVSGSPQIPVPAYVLLGGAHGAAPCHLVWGRTVLRGIEPPFAFAIEWSAGDLSWTTRGQPVPFAKDALTTRLLVRLDPAGSVSLFTNGATVSFSSLEIGGRIRAAWKAEESERLAAEEFSRLLSARR